MLLYRLLISLAAPVLALLLLIRVLRGQESWADFAERLGLWRSDRSGRWIWVHAASNGELTSARALIESLCETHPDTRILITCNSTSGKALAQAWALPRGDVRLAPLDLAWLQHRMLAGHDLKLFVLIEGDFWPNRIRAAKRTGANLALVGGRVSKGSARNWGRFDSIAKPMFGAFDLISAQDAASEARLRKLGTNPMAFAPRQSLKSLETRAMQVPAREARKQVWLAASTHEGEDETLLKAHLLARETLPDLRLILAPRHPKRASQIAALAEKLGLPYALRSTGAEPDETCPLFIADTLGEMDLWYAQAATCYVAGSLVPKGGHTPFEPAAFDCALIHGPHHENFSEIYAQLKNASAALCADTPETIAKALVCLQDDTRAQNQVKAARTALAQTDNSHRLIKALADLAKA